MSNFDVVFDIAAALTQGRVLSATVASLDGKWGVVSCRDALGAFDAKSDAWCFSNGRDIARWDSYEDAAKFARGMSGSSHDDCGYEAIEIPVLPVLAVTVGPIHNAVGPISFGCIDWSRGPGELVETDDDSAFGAAVAFVERVGCERSIAVLEET